MSGFVCTVKHAKFVMGAMAGVFFSSCSAS